jgi:hypothetical protein
MQSTAALSDVSGVAVTTGCVMNSATMPPPDAP